MGSGSCGLLSGGTAGERSTLPSEGLNRGILSGGCTTMEAVAHILVLGEALLGLGSQTMA